MSDSQPVAGMDEVATADGRSVDDQALEIYLRDHHAGATAGTAIAQQISLHHAGTTMADDTAAIAAEIAADLQTLELVMAALQIPPSRVKDFAATVGERIMRLKPNAELSGPRTLSALIELETLSAGITGKAALWRALHRISTTDARLAAFDFVALTDRAYDQRDRVDACHGPAALAALIK